MKDYFPVDLTKAANVGFADEIADDGKGGWTDQGAQNDLRCFEPKVLPAGSIAFHPIDPAQNEGRACIALGRTWKRTASPIIPVEKAGQYLYLLHANAWGSQAETEHGTILVTYADGTAEAIPVKNKVDVADWWESLQRSNAVVFWEGRNPSRKVSLYASQFILRRDDATQIQFCVNKSNSLWMIVAATFSPEDQPLRSMFPTTYHKLGDGWAQLDNIREIQKDSPLDFSYMLDAPAGKHGWLQVRPDGHFAFEKQPDKIVRFIGTNVCSASNFLTHEQSEQLAERLARIGYNALRFHHHDGPLAIRNQGPVIDPEKLDRMEYLFYALKKRGIYILTDVYASRPITPADKIPELRDTADLVGFKALYPVSQALRDNWKQFANNWFTHRNPYTGLTWLEDPALYSISLVNEDNLHAYWGQLPEARKIYLKAYPEWMAKHYPGEELGETDCFRNRRFFEFICSVQDSAIQELASYLKNDLGYKGLYTDLNMEDAIPFALSRDKMDIVDDHQYHDHPTFPVRNWDLPFKHHQQSSIANLGWEIPHRLLSPRIFGKPFSITEYKFCFSNRFRSEGGPVIGAYAALQGWDALHHFTFADNPKTLFGGGLIDSFTIGNDPLSHITDRITMFLLRRGDVSTAKQAYAYRIPTNYWQTDIPLTHPETFTRLGLIARVGTIVGDKECAATVLDHAQAEAKKPLPDPVVEGLRKQLLDKGIAQSVTGEIVMDSKHNVLIVDTPRAKCAVLTEGGIENAHFAVANADTPQSLCVFSLDESPIATSRKLLVFHLSDTSNANARFYGRNQESLEHRGVYPNLIRLAKLDVALNLDNTNPPTIQALKLDGTPYGTIPSTFQNGTLRFTADTNAFPGGVMVYLIER
ncbi:MAG: hypothetical protein IJJ26_05420 [Victivallales bacterium]|nr:hypothetical protein [Victivallales bacterium]